MPTFGNVSSSLETAKDTSSFPSLGSLVFPMQRGCAVMAQTLTNAGFEMPPWRLLPEEDAGEAQRAKVSVATEGLSGAPHVILPGGSFATSHRA